MTALARETVTRFRVFGFPSDLSGKPHKVRGTFQRSKVSKKDSCYIWSGKLESFLRVRSLFAYEGRNLAFCQRLPLEKLKADKFGNDYCSWADWRQSVTVAECFDFSHLVAFVENRRTPGKGYLVRSLRVYNGGMHTFD